MYDKWKSVFRKKDIIALFDYKRKKMIVPYIENIQIKY